jgi:hypothetical protein
MAKLGIYEFAFGNFGHNDLDIVHRLIAMMLFTVFCTKFCPTNNPYLAPDSSFSSKEKSYQ